MKYVEVAGNVLGVDGGGGGDGGDGYGDPDGSTHEYIDDADW